VFPFSVGEIEFPEMEDKSVTAKNVGFNGTIIFQWQRLDFVLMRCFSLIGRAWQPTFPLNKSKLKKFILIKGKKSENETNLSTYVHEIQLDFEYHTSYVIVCSYLTISSKQWRKKTQEIWSLKLKLRYTKNIVRSKVYVSANWSVRVSKSSHVLKANSQLLAFNGIP
jgi:hypothetical protein